MDRPEGDLGGSAGTRNPTFWISARAGGGLRAWRRSGAEGGEEDFSLILGGTLTLLGLIIGFTFSMAVGRYDQRTRDVHRLRQLDAETARLQGEMWSAVVEHASYQPTPVAALVVAGMNDVLNSQGYAQAAWWNRIPVAAWALLVAIAIFCNGLLGYASREGRTPYYLILPIVLSTTLFLIADIDSPRGGVIRVHPHNLEATAASLAPR